MERLCLLSELILLDVDYRGRVGEVPAISEYREPFSAGHPSRGRGLFALSQPVEGRALGVCCPHCHETNDVASDSSLTDIVCSSCGGRFSVVPEATVSHPAPEVKTIGHFELIEQIGMGAFGTVWRARDTSLDRTVALKIPANTISPRRKASNSSARRGPPPN